MIILVHQAKHHRALSVDTEATQEAEILYKRRSCSTHSMQFQYHK